MRQVATHEGINRGLCWTSSDITTQWPIRLEQQGVDRFTVVYGLQVKKDLTYADAASELGACIMHALACEGRLDNSEPKQRRG